MNTYRITTNDRPDGLVVSATDWNDAADYALTYLAEEVVSISPAPSATPEASAEHQQQTRLADDTWYRAVRLTELLDRAVARLANQPENPAHHEPMVTRKWIDLADKLEDAWGAMLEVAQ